VLNVGSLPSSSIISPQRPPSGVSLSSPNGRVQVLLRLCTTTICGQIDRVYVYTETWILHTILWCSESCDCNKDELDKRKCLLVVCCAAVSAALEFSCRAVQRSQLLSNSPAELCSGLSCSWSLPQIYAEVSGASNFDYHISQIS